MVSAIRRPNGRVFFLLLLLFFFNHTSASTYGIVILLGETKFDLNVLGVQTLSP